MNKIHKNKYGFVMPEAILIAGALLLIIGVGWVIYSHYNKTDAAIVMQRQEYIDKYISHINLQNYDSFGTSLDKSGYLTSSLYQTTQSLINSYSSGSFSSSPAYGSIICVDQIPSSYSYGAVNVNSDSTQASLPINVFVADSSTPIPYTAYWVKTNGTWQLNNVNCSKGSPG